MSISNLDELYEINRGKDKYVAPDFYIIDDLLTDEQKLIRDSVRDWVKNNISPDILYFFLIFQ